MNQQFYFNNLVNSLVKDCNAKIREYFDSFTKDLKQVYESLGLYWTKQYADCKSRLKSEKTRTSIQEKKSTFALLFKKIYPYTLNKSVKQLNQPESFPFFTCTFCLSMDLQYFNNTWQSLRKNENIWLDKLNKH